MIFTARAIHGCAEVGSLFPRPEDDLDVPTAAIELSHCTGGHFLARDVGRHEVPLTAQTLGFAERFSFFARLFLGRSEGCFGHFLGGSNGDQPGLVSALSQLDGEIKDVSPAGPEMGIELPAFCVADDEVGGEPAQPKGQFSFNVSEFAQAKVSAIAQDKVMLFDEIDEVFSKIAILFGGGVEFAEERATADEVEGEIHFDSGGDALAVAVGGEMFVVGSGQFLLGRILDENPTEVAFEVGDFAGSIAPFFEQREGERVEHEGHGRGIGAFPDCLFCERK